MNFKKWVKSIQTAGYNGARTVYIITVQILLVGHKISHLVLKLPEGQIKLYADWRAVDSPQKMNERRLILLLLITENNNKFIGLVFGRIYSTTICLKCLSEL